MNIVAVIPARAGSKTIPKKNIKELAGKPLIAYSIDSALKCGFRTIVSTDSEEIAKIAEREGAEVLLRSENLAQDDTSMFEVLKSEVSKIEPAPDLILLLQPTSPLREIIHIKTAVSYLIENLDKYDSLISVEQVPEKYNPAQIIVNTIGGKKMATGVPIAKRLTRRQDFPEAFVPDGSIYLFKTENLKNGSLYGEEVMLLQTEGTININSLEDWEQAEKICQNKA